MLYNILLFLHIIGSIVMFVGVGITTAALIAMLSETQTESLRKWASLAVKVDGLLPLSVLLILPPGLYLTFTAWGWEHTWINLSLALILIMSVTGPVVNLPRLKAILTEANAETKSVPSAHLIETIRNRTLWSSMSIMTMVGVAIIFLMTVKTALLGSFITVAVAIILGFIFANILLKKTSPIVEKNGVEQAS